MENKKIIVYDYTKYDLFQKALALSVGIYNKYNGVLSTQQFNQLTFTSCKIYTYLVHAFCANSRKGKITFYKNSYLTWCKLYDLLEAIEPMPSDIKELYFDVEIHYFTIYDYNPKKKVVPICPR